MSDPLSLNPMEVVFASITVAGVDVADAARWCKAMCNGMWTYESSPAFAPIGKFTGHFADKKDAMAFKLAWGGK